ncbi:MAG: ABC transporter permease [Bacteroidaceae bacterium]|nr:ABC transporter permease [Bacteroidaceae bacterium]
MLLHCLKIAWRNLQKYKTQNIISVLSLAVGFVCFAVTLQALKVMVTDIYFQEIDAGIVQLSVYEMTEEEFMNRKTLDETCADVRNSKPQNRDFVERLYSKEIPAMREVQYFSTSMLTDFEYETEDKGRKIYQTRFTSCSPRYLHYNWYRSDITGERIPELREGDVIISDVVRDKVYGKNTDPRGLKILTAINGKVHTIRDVVNISERTTELMNNSIIYVSRIPQDKYHRFYELPVELSEGATAQQLHKEISAAFPEYFFTYRVNDFDWFSEGAVIITIVLVLLLLGGSVLLIAVIGYLKMQLQLFSLRSRELALRRTMGARKRHLLMLLSIEVLVIFFFAASLSAVISVLSAGYALPIMHGIHNNLSFDVDAVYNIEMWVILGTLFLTLFVAFLVTDRQLRVPVGMRVGRSGHPRTAGRSIILCVQFVTSMFIVLALLGVFYMTNENLERRFTSLPKDFSPYRRAIIVDAGGMVSRVRDFKEKLMQADDVEHLSFTALVTVRSSAPVDGFVMHPSPREGENEYGVPFYELEISVTDEQIFDNLNIKITPECPTDAVIKKHTTAVYVRTEDVERLRNKWGVAPTSASCTSNLYRDRSYTLIGYASALHHYPYDDYYVENYTPSLWLVDNDVDIYNVNGDDLKKDLYMGRFRGAFAVNAEYIMFPKKGRYAACEDVVAEIYREAQPENVNDVPLANLYDKWFPEVLLIELLRKMCLLLTFVSVLCVVASVYSNISLESRRRQKEVALRKIHGARSRDIIRLFGSYYIRLLLVAAIVVAVLFVAVVVVVFGNADEGLNWLMLMLCFVFSVLTVGLVTLATIARKIYGVSKINTADIIKKD